MIESIKFNKSGYCEICERKNIPVLEILVVVPCGYENYDTEISICKECFDINYEDK